MFLNRPWQYCGNCEEGSLKCSGPTSSHFFVYRTLFHFPPKLQYSLQLKSKIQRMLDSTSNSIVFSTVPTEMETSKVKAPTRRLKVAHNRSCKLVTTRAKPGTVLGLYRNHTRGTVRCRTDRARLSASWFDRARSAASLSRPCFWQHVGTVTHCVCGARFCATCRFVRTSYSELTEPMQNTYVEGGKCCIYTTCSFVRSL